MKPLLNNILLTISSAILLTLAFPKYDMWILAWVGLIPLFFVVSRNIRKRVFLWCWFSGSLFYFLTVNWITHTMTQYGGMPLWLSFMVLLLLSVYLGLYTGLFGYLIKLISDKTSIPLPVAAPLLWVSLEFLKAHLISGFPWASLGYSQYKFLHIIQISDITGVYGVSFLIVAVNAALFSLFLLRKESVLRNRTRIISISSVVFLFALSLCYGYYRLSRDYNSTDRGVKIAVLQGNIPQNLKWDSSFKRRTVDIYKRLTNEAAVHNPDLVIWPETAAPFFFQEDSQYRDEILDIASAGHTYLLFGNPAYEITDNNVQNMLNSAYLISPDRETLARYDKIHLVPFGEYVPLSKILFFIEKITAGTGDFTPGRDYVVMELPQGKFGVVICYEVIFPGLVRKFVLNGAEFMATITNDAWFGKTSAPYQHFTMAVFRSVENRIYFARSANTGISGFISPKGEILQASPIFEESLLIRNIFPSDTKTFYTKHGDMFAYGAILITCIMLIKAAIT
ncbi:MAG TPA: apolipoprotein N-acyltransferase [Nitrospirota bacterium]